MYVYHSSVTLTLLTLSRNIHIHRASFHTTQYVIYICLYLYIMGKTRSSMIRSSMRSQNDVCNVWCLISRTQEKDLAWGRGVLLTPPSGGSTHPHHHITLQYCSNAIEAHIGDRDRGKHVRVSFTCSMSWLRERMTEGKNPPELRLSIALPARAYCTLSLKWLNTCPVPRMVTWTFYRSLTEKFANEARAMLMLVGNPTSTPTF